MVGLDVQHLVHNIRLANNCLQITHPHFGKVAFQICILQIEVPARRGKACAALENEHPSNPDVA